MRGHIEIVDGLPINPSFVDIHVNLADTVTSDDGLSGLVAMPAFRNVGRISLDRTRVTSASLKLLTTNPRLYLINLSGTRVSDEGLRSIASLSSLSHLHLDGTDVSDAGLVFLIGGRDRLERLSTIGLRNTKVTAEGIKSLVAAYRLRQLVVDHPAATPPSISQPP